MNAFRLLLPYPVLSIVVLALWLMLAQTISAGHVLLGLAAAFTIPRLTQAFWPQRPTLAHPLTALHLFAAFSYDIVAANLAVARRVIGPLDRLRPSFIEVPLDLRDTFVATLLGSMISLTPGTVSVDIDRKRWVLLVHGLDLEDAPALVRNIKERYETPLREIFSC
ncbi:Na+/H+ antiporter subunit E [Bradyrhizobium sp. USDA 10063]